MNTTKDVGAVHTMVMKAAKSLFYSQNGLSAGEDPDVWGATCYEHIANAQAALTECGALECLKSLVVAVRQNDHDMLMTGEELRECRSAITKAYGSATE